MRKYFNHFLKRLKMKLRWHPSKIMSISWPWGIMPESYTNKISLITMHVCDQSFNLFNITYFILTRLIFLLQVREETRRSDHNWIKTVLRTGTTGDKMSANCILVQDSAVHNLSSVENLIHSVKINKKRECMLAIGNYNSRVGISFDHC